jgi:predicted aspartyl protease
MDSIEADQALAAAFFRRSAAVSVDRAGDGGEGEDLGTRRSFLIRAGLVAGVLGGAWWLREHVVWPSPRATFADDAAPVWAELAEQRARVLIIPAVVAGTPVRALVDSGAQYSVVDRGLVDRLGLGEGFDIPLLAYGVGGGSQVGRGVTVDVTAAGATFSRMRAAILDLGPLADAGGLSTPLILGQDVLGQADLWLDLPAGRLALAPPGAAPPWSDLTAVPVTRRGSALAATVTVEGAETDALIDTGSSSLLALSRSAAAAAGLLDGRERRRGTSLVLGGAVRSELVTVRTLTFGDALFRNATVAIYDDVAGRTLPQGLVGLPALRGRRTVMRLGAGELWLSQAVDVDLG